MKSIRPTRSTTRRGVLNWLVSFGLNSWLAQPTTLQCIYDADDIVAVHVNRYTGAIVSWETRSGERVSPGILSVVNVVQFREVA